MSKLACRPFSQACASMTIILLQPTKKKKKKKLYLARLGGLSRTHSSWVCDFRGYDCGLIGPLNAYNRKTPLAPLPILTHTDYFTVVSSRWLKINFCHAR